MPDGNVLDLWAASTTAFRVRFGFRLRRWKTLARRTKILDSSENDGSIAELARTIATSYFADSDTNQLVLRCRRYQPTSWEEAAPDRTQTLEQQFTDLYVADAMRDSTGVVRVLKRVANAEAAQLRTPLQPHRRDSSAKPGEQQ